MLVAPGHHVLLGGGWGWAWDQGTRRPSDWGLESSLQTWAARGAKGEKQVQGQRQLGQLQLSQEAREVLSHMGIGLQEEALQGFAPMDPLYA